MLETPKNPLSQKKKGMIGDRNMLSYIEEEEKGILDAFFLPAKWWEVRQAVLSRTRKTTKDTLGD